jgi:hypothetical protein
MLRFGRSGSYNTEILGLIAQGIEHPPSKRAVAGSNPAQSELLGIKRSTHEPWRLRRFKRALSGC